MNIQIQICGLCILALVFIFYKSHRTLQVYREKVFYYVFCIVLISLIFDIMSVVAISSEDVLKDSMVKIICRLYSASLIWVSYSSFVYVLVDLFEEQRHRRLFSRLAGVVILQCILSFILPIGIHKDGNSIYTYGASIVCVYIFSSTFIISTLILAGVFRKKLNLRRSFAVVIWMIVWIASALIQFFNNELLIVGFASAVGVLILFTIIENPEANLDRRLGCFNSYALSEYMKTLFELGKEFAVLDVSLQNAALIEENDWLNSDNFKKSISKVKSDKEIFVFKNITNGLVLVSTNADKLESISANIWSLLQSSGENVKQVDFVYTPQASAFRNMDELFNFISFVHDEYSKNNEHFLIVDDEMINRYHDKFRIMQEIDEALEEDRVEVFLQPIFSNNENSFTSAEALTRIRNRDGSLLPPGKFIPIAEETGQIIALGERILEKVCGFLKDTEALDMGIHYIEVNLSVIQFELEDLAERVISIAEKYQVNPRWINLEITETASINARTVLLENMKKLIDYGFTFSLDDFGKGESNLMYVVEMPVSIVKFDYDMSKAFFTSQKAKHVVRAVISMAHKMGLKLVAEGIETHAEIDGMHSEGIDYIQGYFYSKPLPMCDFLNYIREQNAI